MLRMRLSNGLCILGLDAENIRRLQKGHPILVCLSELGGKDDVCIMFGETLKDIQNEIANTLGVVLPEPQTLNELRNPQ